MHVNHLRMQTNDPLGTLRITIVMRALVEGVVPINTLFLSFQIDHIIANGMHLHINKPQPWKGTILQASTTS